MRTGTVRKFLAPICFLILLPSVSFAQGNGVCTQTQLGDPPRIVYRCESGLVVEAEAAAALQIEGQQDQNRPGEMRLDSDAALIEVKPGNGPFQILTPHAIAAVRGTIYAVDVHDDMTSVFVVRGGVSVSRPDGSDTVLLGPGQGVNVSDGQPLVVTTWPQARVASLMARFGR